jgi:hypothetical protein
MPATLSIASIVSPVWHTTMFSIHFVVLASLASAFLALGGLYMQPARETKDTESTHGAAALLVIGSLFAYVLLWLSLHAVFLDSPDLAVMVALFVYTVIGITAYILGGTRGEPAVRAYGGLLLAFVVGRLLVVDVWQMQLTGRIITFLLIGALLMSTAFLGKESAPRAES